MPRYHIVFPDGQEADASLDEPVKSFDAISRRTELFQVEKAPLPEVLGHISEPIRVELRPWPREAPVVGRIYDVTH